MLLKNHPTWRHCDEFNDSYGDITEVTVNKIEYGNAQVIRVIMEMLIISTGKPIIKLILWAFHAYQKYKNYFVYNQAKSLYNLSFKKRIY